MNAVEQYRRNAAVVEKVADTLSVPHLITARKADAALAELEAAYEAVIDLYHKERRRADRAEALLRYVLLQDMEHGDRGTEPLDGLITRLQAAMDAAGGEE